MASITTCQCAKKSTQKNLKSIWQRFFCKT